jgi:hypothetical protein
MNVIGDLRQIAHIKPLRADRTFFEMVGLALCDAVPIEAGVSGSRSASSFILQIEDVALAVDHFCVMGT